MKRKTYQLVLIYDKFDEVELREEEIIKKKMNIIEQRSCTSEGVRCLDNEAVRQRDSYFEGALE